MTPRWRERGQSFSRAFGMAVDIKLIVTDAAPLITLAAVREAGRNPATRDLWSQHDPDIRDAVKKILGRPAGDEGS
jgi:hypothetical protein